ncbi:proline dehydrogenase family protein [Brevibacterium sp. BRM-1]|uniref:proline dehydrogenase family protein n=1 Tax=Brevibacterium sp. BRM-1 TaxID=2999062 RepID=UPI0022810B54|nr:proline dehydrogenase family protein [Brevibacterium sp. BRM-1]WAL39238.1 proline dehydrogenase family protein [Brevibacterium sp. BRM-1]
MVQHPTQAHERDPEPNRASAPVPAPRPEPEQRPGPRQPGADLGALATRSVDLVRRWLRRSAADASAASAAADRLSAVLTDPSGLNFTVGFVDRVIRTEDSRAAASALTDIAHLAPAALPALDRAQIRAGAALAPVIPDVVVPLARGRLRQMVGHMVVDARDRPFGAAVAQLTAEGHRLNINLLGEAVLGEDEADHHLAQTHRLLARDDVDYVSIKVSSVASQLSLWAFDDTVAYVVERLLPLYREAAQAPAGTKFINLDMEEYGDLELTIAVFTALLDRPELAGLEAGIVIQAYLPDALGAVQRLSAFAARRADSGGAGIKVRLVKGANLAVERVHAELADWPLTTEPDKQSTDANYLRVLAWLLRPERMRGLRLGVAGHNLFDIAFAHLLADERGVSQRVEFEMLHGMAAEHSAAVSADVGDLLLYVPAVRPQEFDVAISYLVRRLEENSAPENFMSGIFELRNGNAVFRKEEAAFRASVDQLADTLRDQGERPPEPNRTQDRAAQAATGPRPPAHGLEDFRNEPDTDPSLPANQRWISDLLGQALTPGWLDSRPAPEPLDSPEQAAAMVERGRAAAADWRALGARARGEVLLRAAEVFAARRGEFLQTVAAEVGKAPLQADAEISEAIDFIRYYAHRGLALEDVPGARFEPDSLVLVTPPWNFPIAIPTCSTVAALAAGAAVIHKPSSPTPHASALICACLWEAGVPREVLQLAAPVEGELGRALVAHPGVDRVVLTGASETAALFQEFNPELRVNAETSGKNALIITPAADRDLAVADLVASAFGHAGQKCSAASLAILVGSVGDSQRYRRQLVDAARSLVVDWPRNGRATVGPLTEQPSDKLERALTRLEPGEEWLLEPRRLDDTGRLWSPGIRTGVAPGSFFHLTEAFGPVLGIMHAQSLEQALEWQNAVDYGLTAGIHSLDTDEVRQWLDRVQAGNAYVNRGITGAIVGRQPFGGWKKSSVGLGSKAGGPNYLMQFGSWHDASLPGAPGGAGAEARGGGDQQARPGAGPGDAEAAADAWLAAAYADDEGAWAHEFGIAHDPTGLHAEANIFRYLPRAVTVRVGKGADAHALARTLHAAATVGSRVLVSLSPAAAERPEIARRVDEAAVRAETADARTFAAAVARGDLDDTVGARIRVLGDLEPELRTAAAQRPEVAVLDDAVTGSGRVEQRYFVQEQAVSMTLHRFGNPSREFRALADSLRGDADRD